MAVLLTPWVAVAACTQQPEPISDDMIARNNAGVALMGQYRNEPARAIFAALYAERPDWTDVRVNEAIAILNRQDEGDERRALAIVNEVLERQPGHIRAAYLSGLIHFYLGEAAPALARLEALRDDVPDDAYLAYFTGQALRRIRWTAPSRPSNRRVGHSSGAARRRPLRRTRAPQPDRHNRSRPSGR